MLGVLQIPRWVVTQRLPGSVHGTGEQCSPSQFTKSPCILSMSGDERHQWEFDTMSVLMGLGEGHLALLHFTLRLRTPLNALGLIPPFPYAGSATLQG